MREKNSGRSPRSCSATPNDIVRQLLSGSVPAQAHLLAALNGRKMAQSSPPTIARRHSLLPGFCASISTKAQPVVTR